jgi:hypothetical protein
LTKVLRYEIDIVDLNNNRLAEELFRYADTTSIPRDNLNSRKKINYVCFVNLKEKASFGSHYSQKGKNNCF